MRTSVSTGVLAGLLSSFLITSVAAKNTAKRPSFRQKLQTHAAAFEIQRASPVRVLIHTAIQYQLPLALEFADWDAVKPVPRIKLPPGQVRQRIESLVAMIPGFRVSFSNSLVDVYFPPARADSSNLLNTRLRGFQVQDVDAGLAAAMVHGALLAQERPQSILANSSAGVGGTPVSVDAHNAPVYEVLNGLVSQQGSSLWVVGAPPGQLQNINADLWRFYPLSVALEPIIVERVEGLFRRR